MKVRLLFLLILGLIGGELRAQNYQIISDANFVNWLQTHGYATVMVGNTIDVTSSIVQNTTSIDCNGQNIFDLDGIGYFSHLQYLDCGDNYLSILPQLPSSLLELRCENNHNSYGLNVAPFPLGLKLLRIDNSVTSLPNLPSGLEYLSCTGDPNGKYLTSLPFLPSTLVNLYCGYNRLTALPPLPASLRTLSCESNRLTYIADLPDTLLYLDVGGNPDLDVIQPLNFVSSLYFAGTAITCLRGYNYIGQSNPSISSLSTCPSAFITIPDTNFVTWLYGHGYALAMNGNQLDTVISMDITYPSFALNISNQNISDFEGLQYLRLTPPTANNVANLLNLSHNNLDHFPTELYSHMARNRIDINLSFNKIDTLVLDYSFLSVRNLDVSNNQLTNVQSLTSQYNLGELNLSDNRLESLPSIASIYPYTFKVRNNLLHRVPSGSYVNVDCGKNLIDTLFAAITFSTGLNELICDSNNMSSYYCPPTYNLSKLNCSYNNLTELTAISNLTTQLICNNNQLTSLPVLPNLISRLDCQNNPNLSCFPNFPNNSAFQFNYSNTNLSCLPHKFPNCVYSGIPGVNALPDCSLYNPFVCPQYANIEGNVFVDANSNCVLDTLENRIPQIKVQLIYNSTVVQQVYTNAFGHYSFHISLLGNYTVVIDSTITFTVNCPVASNYAIRIDSTTQRSSENNFSLACQALPDAYVSNPRFSAVHPFRPGVANAVTFSTGAYNQVAGLNCSQGIGGQILLISQGPISYAGVFGTTVPPSYVTSDTLVWIVPDFGNINPGTYGALFATDTTAILATPICFDICLIPNIPDYNLNNNCTRICDYVRDSHDPNEKTVYPNGNIEPLQDWLTYTINFQNTGNAQANYVYILDSLDSNLDWNTFELLSCSHYNITQILAGGIVRFNFPSINLPDSTSNESQSHGFIQYKIKPKPNLPVGTTINNKAGIYFDYNPPIITNIVRDTIAIPMSAIVNSQSLLFCDGDSVKLSFIKHPNYNYQWLKNGMPIQGATDSVFTATVTGAYSYGVYYNTVADTSAVSVVTVYAKPLAEVLAASASTCQNGGAVSLTFSPQGGNLTGIGINGINFEPLIAGLGTFSIGYYYIDSNGCADTAFTAITVNAKPNASINLVTNSICRNGSALNLSASPLGGVYSGTGVTGSLFDPSSASLGANTITYIYEDGNGCEDTAVSTITVNANPVVSAGTDIVVCVNDVPFALNGMPADGIFSGTGVQNGILDPTTAGTGLHNIGYEYTDTNGCVGNDGITVLVNPKPVVDLAMPIGNFCAGTEPADLIIYSDPVGGTFSGTGVSGTEIDISATGTYPIAYAYTDVNGCSDTAHAYVVVDECIGVCELEVIFKFHPNPTTNTLYLSTSHAITGAVITIYDLTGKVLMQETATEKISEISTTALASGTYIISVQGAKGVNLFKNRFTVLH